MVMGPAEQELGPSVTRLPTPGDTEAVFSWPPQMVSGTLSGTGRRL